jgi:hypothetical protein
MLLYLLDDVLSGVVGKTLHTPFIYGEKVLKRVLLRLRTISSSQRLPTYDRTHEAYAVFLV